MTIKFNISDRAYGFLSNFYPSRLKREHIDDEHVAGHSTWVAFASVEHAFQASKCVEVNEVVKFLGDSSPADAKALGKRVRLRSDWETAKDAIMEHWVRKKFTQHADLAEKLLATGEEELVENTYWHDQYWGICNCDGTKKPTCKGGGQGQNKLGKILMKVRTELRHKATKGITSVVSIRQVTPGWEAIDSGFYYIGREHTFQEFHEGEFGNPHPIGFCRLCEKEHDRATCIEAFRKDFNIAILFPEGQFGWKNVEKLRGKKLVCFCHPEPCHGDVIAHYLNTGTIIAKGVPQKGPGIKIVCGTGHRPDKLGGYDEEVFWNIVRLCRFAIPKVGATHVISGGALGFDQALAMAARDLKVPYSLFLPFEGFDSKWPLMSRSRLAELVKTAFETRYICPPGYSAAKMMERNRAMVDEADYVLCLWNGTDGGTANCVHYAQTHNKPSGNLWERWLKREF